LNKGKYNKATFAAVVGAVATLIDVFSDFDIPAAAQAAVVTIVVFLVPNAE
jgi:hypothetical protein